MKKIKAVVKIPEGKVDDTTFRNDDYDFTHQDLITIDPPYTFKIG